MIINWGIIKHPLNWGIVLMMLLIAAYGGHLLLKYFGASPAAATPDEANRNDISGYVLQAAAPGM
jgi:hypothetical protein